MKKVLSRLFALVMVTTLLLGLVACGNGKTTSETAGETSAETAAETDTADEVGTQEEHHKIGVIVYDVSDNEVQMFRQYFEQYIAQSFPVEFVYSASVSNWEEESQFLDAAIEDGVQGFISFIATNLPEAVKKCEAAQVYYMIGSGNYSQDLLDQVKDNQWFLGSIGTTLDTDYQAGADMVASYMQNADKNVRAMVTTGGTALGNVMHQMRAKGMLEKLAELNGYTYEKPVDEMIQVTDITAFNTGVDGVQVVICPGYDIDEKLEAALGQYDVDAVFSALAAEGMVSKVAAAEKEREHDTWVGMVDCFSQWNRDLFNKKDAFGQPSLNYVAGKYASITGPAFAAMYQAVCADAGMLRPDGKAFQLSQGLWTADSPEKYEELYAYTESYVKNAYSSQDLMKVITAYNPDATFDDFKALTEASDVESAVARMNK